MAAFSTQKTGFIGNDQPANRFKPVPNSDEAYFLQINPETGETEVWNENFANDKKVGTYVDGEFQPNDSWWMGASNEEKEFFATEEGQQAVNVQAQNVLDKADGKVNQVDENLTEAEQRDLKNDVEGEIGEEGYNAEVEARAKKLKEAVGRKQYRKNLCYPVTLKHSQQDKLKISVLKYVSREFTGLTIADRAPAQSRTVGAVVLPVPTGGVSDTNSVSWKDGQMNAAQIAGADLGLAAITGKDVGQVVDKIGEQVGGNSEELKKNIANMFVGSAVGVKDMLSRQEGAVVNPNMELLFSAPALRPFEFSYRLAPRDRKESDEVLQIIRMFKQSMAVKTTASSLFLKSPNTYKLSFLAGGNPNHRFLPKIKECALTSFSVNYVPDGSYMTYEDNSMVAYEIRFTFKELEPIYNADYGNLNNNPSTDLREGIGF